jgi:glutathione peroxidase
LQALHKKYAEQGLAILGFPCNQFGKQEPGSATEIRDFCTKNYGVSFDMFEKIDVNGDDANSFYKHLTSLDLKPAGSGKISWNFEKFLIDREGNVVARFSPRTSPDDAEVVAAIEKALGK